MVMAAESLARVMRGVAAAVVANRAEAREVRNFIVVFGKRIVCSSESRGSVVVEIKDGGVVCIYIWGELLDRRRKEKRVQDKYGRQIQQLQSLTRLLMSISYFYHSTLSTDVLVEMRMCTASMDQVQGFVWILRFDVLPRVCLIIISVGNYADWL